MYISSVHHVQSVKSIVTASGGEPNFTQNVEGACKFWLIEFILRSSSLIMRNHVPQHAHAYNKGYAISVARNVL
jgi:hypothetical protein